MIANELRYENWVIYNDELWQINAVDGSADEVDLYNGDHASDVDIDDIEPIPLTEQILVDCGFELDETATDFLLDKTVTKKDFGIYISATTFDFYNGIFSQTIKSLHQLQNLYFALTGAELTYNPKP